MDVKEAIRTAKHYVTDAFAEEPVADLGLEEVEFDESANVWRVTIGFARPWEVAQRSLKDEASLAYTKLGEQLGVTTLPRRAYKVVTIADDGGKVLSVKNREVG